MQLGGGNALDLDDGSLQDAILERVDFGGANLNRVCADGMIARETRNLSVHQSSLANVNLPRVENFTATDSDLQGIGLYRASDLSFTGSDLSGADLRETSNVTVAATRLDGADLRESTNVQFYGWLYGRSPNVGVSLGNANLGGINFRGKDLTGICDLQRARLEDMEAGSAMLAGAFVCDVWQDNPGIRSFLNRVQRTWPEPREIIWAPCPIPACPPAPELPDLCSPDRWDP